MNWIKIAFRNIIKNKRRSFVTLLAIGMGYAAVSLFYGYADRIYDGLRDRAIQGEGLGHLTIYKQGWLERGRFDPARYMHSPQELARIIDILETDPEVVLATPQLNAAGLVTNGSVSTIFLAHGVVPEDYYVISGDYDARSPEMTPPLNSQRPYRVEMAEELGRILGFQPGSNGVIMGTTLDGQMNALDIEIAGLYDTGTAATNDKYIRMPLTLIQSLYDTQTADRIVVLLKSWKQTEPVRLALQKKLSAQGFNCEIKTWKELSQFYLKVKGMFDIIFLFILSIVLVIVVMSVVNTMGMAVVERTREIGTLRALGLKRYGVNLIFGYESMLLGALGCILGVFITATANVVINALNITYIPPGNSSPIHLSVNIVPLLMMTLMGFMILLSLVAAVIPAHRASRQSVVAALGHV